MVLAVKNTCPLAKLMNGQATDASAALHLVCLMIWGNFNLAFFLSLSIKFILQYPHTITQIRRRSVDASLLMRMRQIHFLVFGNKNYLQFSRVKWYISWDILEASCRTVDRCSLAMACSWTFSINTTGNIT